MSEIRESACEEGRGGCGVAIFWCITQNGKRMPVDWDGSDEGDFYIVHNDARIGGDARVPLAIHRSKYHKALGHRLMRTGRRFSHWATCPNAKNFRRK